MKLTEQQITEELRTMRPAPSAEFLVALDERVGTPGLVDRLAALPEHVWGSTRRLRPMHAAAAAMAVVMLSAVSVGVIKSLPENGSDSSAARSGDGGAGQLSAPASDTGGAGASAAETAKGTAVAPDTVSPAPPSTDDLAAGAAERNVERSAELTLSTDPGNVAEVADGVIEVTDRYDGFVERSSVNTGDGGGSGGRLELRIPTARLQDALADLSKLAHVSARNEGSLDITAPTVSSQARVKDAKSSVDSLLDQLAGATTATETDALRAQLHDARAELGAARAEALSLEQRADLTRVTVSIQGSGGTGSWGIGDAADDAVSILKTIAGVTLVSLAILVPLALLGSLLWLGTRGARRRSRERALDE